MSWPAIPQLLVDKLLRAKGTSRLLQRWQQSRRRQARRVMKVEMAEPRQMLAADFNLVSDINVETNAYENSSGIEQVGSIGYFTATTPSTGLALFKTDGTTNGTVMVKAINAGSNFTASVERAGVGGILFFATHTAANGMELWSTNGTAAGTKMVKDILPGAADSDPDNFTNVNGTLFFTASDSNGSQLWRSDGTEAGTVLVKPFNASLGANNPRNLINANGTLYFSADNSTHGREPWKSDGTAAGTKMVADLTTFTPNALPDSNPTRFTNVGSLVYFTGETRTTNSINSTTVQYLLWRTDGTVAGTTKLATSAKKDTFTELTNVNGQLFLVVDGDLHKLVGTSLVLLSNTNTAGSDAVRSLTNVSGTLYFAANRQYFSQGTFFDFGSELFKLNVSTSSLTLVRDINPGEASSSPGDLTNVNGTLYFTAEEANGIQSLWKSNGTETGTVLLKVGTEYLPPQNLGNLGSTLFFKARDINFNVGTVWKSDGTPAGTAPIRPVASLDANPTGLTNLNGQLLFAATGEDIGTELWISDGTDSEWLVDINPGSGSSNPSSLINANGTLYFAAFQPATGIELWKSDGTTAGTQLALDIRRGVLGSAPSQIVNIGSTIYFTADNFTNGRELWRLSSRGAELVKDIRPGAGSSAITGLTVLGDTLYFQANDGTNGPELWKSNGTAAGTSMVRDIRGGALGSAPDNFTVMGSVLYFHANDGTNGRELWRSNGTSAGTIMVKNIHNRGVGIGSDPADLTVVNSTLYFRASDGATGTELWKSDGTAIGTVRVKDIFAGIGGSLPNDLTNVNGKLYFVASDSLGDTELWASDGTATGTLRVRNINPSGSSFPISLTNVNGLLYFTADDSVNGDELYKSDGTALGTQRIASFIRGFSGGNPRFMTTVGTQVFLSADDDRHGRELFVQNLLQGTGLTDVYTVRVSQTGDSVTVSHASSLVQAAEVYGTFSKSQILNFDGQAGSDSLRIEASDGADLFSVDSAGIRTNGALLKALGFETLTLVGKAGDDTYRFNADVNQSNVFRLDESGGGIDTIDFSPSQTQVQLDMSFAAPQAVNAKLSLSLLSANYFENAIGGAASDVLFGNALANTLDGSAGNDLLVGADGQDVLIGNIGDDDLGGEAGNDLLQGGVGNDRYSFGAASSDEQDQLVELIDEGSDTLDFSALSTTVQLNLGLSTSQAVHAGRSILLNTVDTFENATGGAAADSLIGSSIANVLNGGGGNDDLRGGLGDDVYAFDAALTAEADQITELASAGLDTISFASMDIPITLNMATTAVQSVHINRTLKLSSATTFENAVGGSGDDVLAGNGAANVLIGNGGNDELSGLGKRDMLIGGLGADTLNGGDDEDIMIAGRTLHDAIFANVNTLLSNWTATTSQVARITALRTGVGSPSVALVKEVDVLDDAGNLDSLTGAGALDWFFRAVDDLVTDLNGEVIDEI